jgi:FMN phosphatase YigB (HAD superfamily)
VGDQPKLDVLAARAVGMRALWISGGATWPLAEPAPVSIAHVLALEAALDP